MGIMWPLPVQQHYNVYKTLRQNETVFVAAGVERSQEGDVSDENDEAEFFDAMEDSPAFITVTATGNTQHK